MSARSNNVDTSKEAGGPFDKNGEKKNTTADEPATFAPFNTPLKRRRQTCAVLMWALAIPISFALTIGLFWAHEYAWAFLIPYYTYCFFDKTHQKGGRKSDWFRRLAWWRWFCDFFPQRLIKTSDLDPNKNYVFGYHPHGVISMGAFGSFATEATGIVIILLTPLPFFPHPRIPHVG